LKTFKLRTGEQDGTSNIDVALPGDLHSALDSVMGIDTDQQQKGVNSDHNKPRVNDHL